MWAASWEASSSRNLSSTTWRTRKPCLRPTRRRRRRRTVWSRWPSPTFRYSGPYLSSPPTISPSTSGRSWELRRAAWSSTAWWRTLRPAWCQPPPSHISRLPTAWITIILKAFCLTINHPLDPLDSTTLAFLRGRDEVNSYCRLTEFSSPGRYHQAAWRGWGTRRATTRGDRWNLKPKSYRWTRTRCHC